MAIEKITIVESRAVPLDIENIDTDQIIPARFLKAVEREGFGENLFRDWRFDGQGNIIREFPLNDPRYGGRILLAGKNFGCGSSREHAAWAIADHGFNIVVSSFFADIFRNNALNCGILPVQVSGDFLRQLMETVTRNPESVIRIDLPAEAITNLATGTSESFPIDGYKKECLVSGYDDIDYLLSISGDIGRYELENIYQLRS